MLAPRIMPRLALAVRDEDESLVDACLNCLADIRADTERLIPKFIKAEESREQVRQRLEDLEIAPPH